jgi:hypothetical protein
MIKLFWWNIYRGLVFDLANRSKIAKTKKKLKLTGREGG